MGNYISCTLSSPTGSKHSRSATKVIFPTGEIRQIYEPVKAADLMLESPNYFVVNTESLQMGRRFSALNADEDLEMANVYILFPMKRVNSIVTASDMGALFLVSVIGNARILPETIPAVAQSREEEDVPKLNLEDIEDLPEFKHRLSMCRDGEIRRFVESLRPEAADRIEAVTDELYHWSHEDHPLILFENLQLQSKDGTEMKGSEEMFNAIRKIYGHD